MTQRALRSYLAAFLALLALPAGAGSLTSGADFLLMTTGARPDGMGQAFSAVADDINTLSFNPAGLGNIRQPQVGYGHESFLAGINYDFVGAAVPFGGAGVLGLGYLGMGTAPFNSTNSAATPSVTVQNTALIGAWGKSFYDLHLGAAVKYISEQFDTVQGNGIAFDLGARYRVTPRFTLAASILNLGSGVQFASMEPLPLAINAGAAWTVLDLPHHSLTLATDVSDQATDSTQRYSFGAEYWYENSFALRAGYLANSEVEGFSAGAGIRVSFFQLDYAFEPYGNLGSVHRFSGLFQWDGPWVSGDEPNAPQNVTVHQTYQGLEVQWQRPQGPAQGYEVLIRASNGGDWKVSAPVTGTAYEFKDYSDGTPYQIAVRTLGEGETRSFPSAETSFTTQNRETLLQQMVQKQDAGKTPKQSLARGLFGRVDGIGLQLSWSPSGERGIVGYNLYRKSPTGQMVKVTREPRSRTKVWVTDASGFWGWQWLVTAVDRQGDEKTLGTYLWYPTTNEMAPLLQAPSRRLSAVPQPGRQVFLAWDGEPAATGYVLFDSTAGDGVYEMERETSNTDTNLLMNVPGTQDAYSFIVVPRNSAGEWYPRSQEAKITLTGANP